MFQTTNQNHIRYFNQGKHKKYCLQLVDASHSFTHLQISVIIEAREVHIMQQNCDAIGGPGEPKQ